MLLIIILPGCAVEKPAEIAASTMPVAEFTTAICEGTGLTVTQLITEEISCLHDYTVQVTQMRAIENAHIVIISGAGLEDFLEDTLQNAKTIISASDNVDMICYDDHNANHETHHHEDDPHIWLSPTNAMQMCPLKALLLVQLQI